MSDARTIPSYLEAILFDLDGTLIETDNRWAGILADKLTPLRRVLPRLDPAALGRKLILATETPMNYAMSFLEHLGLASSFLGLADRVRRSKGVATHEDVAAIRGSEALLDFLVGRFRLGVVTTRARREAGILLASTGLTRYFTVIITRQDVVWMKPNPEPIHKAAARLGVDPGHCLMIGDTEMDIRAARRAGACAVGVLSGFGECAELERAGAHLVLHDITELREHLLRPESRTGERSIDKMPNRSDA